MEQFRSRQLQTGFLQTGHPSSAGIQTQTGGSQTRDPGSDRAAPDQTSQTRPDSIGWGISAKARQPKPQTGHSSLNRTASDQTSKLRPYSLLQDIQIGSRQAPNEHPGLGLNFLTSVSQAQTRQPQPRHPPDSIGQDIQAETGHPSTAPDLRHLQAQTAHFNSGRRPDSLRPDIQTQSRQSHIPDVQVQTRLHQTEHLSSDWTASQWTLERRRDNHKDYTSRFRPADRTSSDQTCELRLGIQDQTAQP